MGASGNIVINPRTYIPSLLISLTKIKELSSFFHSKKKENFEGISNILYSLNENNNKLDEYVDEFIKVLTEKFGNISRLDIHKILNYILETLHEELNENKKKEENSELNKSKIEKSYNEFADNFKNNNNSIINNLFFGMQEGSMVCSKCNKINKIFSILKMYGFDLSLYNGRIELRDLIASKDKEFEEENKCKECNRNCKCLVKYEIKELPDIFIMSFNNNERRNKMEYYLNFNFKEKPYNLLCFIMKVDEDNKKDENYNVFFIENKKWYIYKVSQRIKKEIPIITKIIDNPLVVFYQKDRNVFTDFYNNISKLLTAQDEIKDLINEHILAETEYDNYYIVSLKFFNRLTKIFESEEKYTDENIIINNIKDIKNVTQFNCDELFENYKIFENRRKALKNKDLYKIDFGIVKKDETTEIKYPKDFVLIKENILNEIFKGKILKSLDVLKENIYKVKFGENYIFIKDKGQEEKDRIFVCYLDENKFSVEIILDYNKDYFMREIKRYISNKGGLEYYYSERKLNFEPQKVQKIIDKEEAYIGDLINITNLENHFNKNKYNSEEKIEVNNNENNPDNSIKMSMFDNDNNNNNNINYNNNYNNNNNNINYNNNYNYNNNNNENNNINNNGIVNNPNYLSQNNINLFNNNYTRLTEKQLEFVNFN